LDVPPPQPRGAGWFIHLAEDPDAAWRVIAPHALHETNSYARWKDSGLPSGHSTWEHVTDADPLRANGRYRVMTPDDATKHLLTLPEDSSLSLHPLMAGLDPGFAWRSLELFEKRVFPRLREAGRLAAPPPVT
jgi:hypothetical protein